MAPAPPAPRRADARRSVDALLAAAATVFVSAGVDAPVRDIAAEAGVGVGTVYRHFPTRADLVVAVYRHQVETCAAAAETLLQTTGNPSDALRDWVELFVDFLVTKHGLAAALVADADAGALHAYFLDRLVPACALVLDACVRAGQAPSAPDAYQLMRGVGNLCLGDDTDPRYDAGPMVRLLLSGLQRPLT